MLFVPNKLVEKKIIFTFLMRVILFLFMVACRILYASPSCGDLTASFGPFDYRDPALRQGGSNSPLYLVESAHFTAKVENLVKGGNTGSVLGDISYTLRVFPNHPRALYAISRYERQEIKKSQSKGEIYTPPMRGDWPESAECFFDRAVRWRSDDPSVRLVYGIHLHLTGRLNEALQQYQISEKLQPKSADLNYNMGLLYFDLKKYDLSKGYAQRAYQLGYPLPGLRKKLVNLGLWP